MNALLISTTNCVSVVTLPKGNKQLKFLQGCVGGFIERVSSAYGDIYVNEEGRREDLDDNQIGSMIAGIPLVGVVVITGKDCASLPESQIGKIKALIGDKVKRWDDERAK